MTEPIYEALLAGRQSPGDEKPAVGASPQRERLASLVSELDGCAFFADGTRRGELVPLADFTRHRMAKALRDASATLMSFPEVDRLLTPGIARLAAERDPAGQRADAPRRELMAAAKCYLQVAQFGADGWHNPDGSYAPPGGWPWRDDEWSPSADREKNLVTAGALIAAALDAPAPAPAADGRKRITT